MSYGVCVHFFSLLAAYSVQRPYLSMYGVWFSCLGDSTHAALLNRVESKVFRIIICPPLTDSLHSIVTDVMLHLYLFSIAIFMLTAFLNLRIACLHLSLDLAAQGFLLLFIPILSIFLTSIFTLSSHILVSYETLFLCLFFHLLMT